MLMQARDAEGVGWKRGEEGQGLREVNEKMGWLFPFSVQERTQKREV